MEAEVEAVVEGHLDEMDRLTDTYDDDDAYLALAQAMAAVAVIDQELRSGGLVDKLEKWVKRLLDGLTKLVKKLADATSFSLSVGTGVSVTINFTPS